MRAVKLWDEVRSIANVGVVNAKHDKETLLRAAARGEELEERVFLLEERLAIETETNQPRAAAADDEDYWDDLCQ